MSESNQNGKDNKISTWFVISVCSAIIAILLSINGWLLTKGFESVTELGKQNKIAIQSLCADIQTKDNEGKNRDFKMMRRMDRMEILITMPFDKRIEALKNLQGITNHDEDKP